MSAPTLRFTGFIEPWSKHKFGSIYTFIKTHAFSRDALTDDGGEIRNIHYGDIHTKLKSSFSASNESLPFIKPSINTSNFSDESFCRVGDLVIADASEDYADIGKAIEIIDIGQSKIVAGLHTHLARNQDESVALGFANQLMQTVIVRKQLQRLAVGSSVLGISKTNLSKILISKPSKAEQEKIASFLSKIDLKIKVLETSYKAICSYKKGVTQKLFSQNIRFKDDAGNPFPDWEYVPLEELLTYHQPTAFLVDSTEYSDLYKTPVLTAGKTFILGYTNETNGIFTDKLPAIIFDDFTTAFKYVDFPFKAKSSAMKILVAKDDSVNLKYVFEAMSEIRFQMGNEHKRYWISEYSKLEVPKPSQLEQEKISNFLSLLDSKALNCKMQLERSKQYKQGLLQQMFV